jgi:predicted transcriptional regulator
MNRLVQKGFLVRRKSRGIYRYSPRVAKARLLRTLIRDFVERALGGSVSPFMVYLAQEGRLSDQEIAQLKQIVKSLDDRPGGRP